MGFQIKNRFVSLKFLRVLLYFFSKCGTQSFMRFQIENLFVRFKCLERAVLLSERERYVECHASRGSTCVTSSTAREARGRRSWSPVVVAGRI